MRKLIIGIFITLLSFSVATATQTQIKVIKSDNISTTLTFDIGSYELIKVETPKGIAYIPKIEKAIEILNEGYPAMPRISESIIVPDKGQSVVKVLDAKYKTIQNINIAPSKGNLYRDVLPSEVPYTYGTIYNQNKFYPETVAELAHNYILRDFRGQTVWINPIQYNPVKKELRIYTEITVKISTNNKKGINEITRKKTIGKISTVYNQIYKNQFANYDQIQTKYTPLSEEGSMLVIAKTEYLETMESFIAWKNQIGIKTELVDLNEVGTTTSQIEAYIKNYYETNDNTFVLLIGDNEHIPPTSTSAGPSDAAYGYIEGNDSYAEIIIGRLSGSVNEVALMTQKTISYEKEPVTNNALYDRFILIASNEGGSGGDDGESDVQHMRNIKPKLINFTYTEDGSYEFFDATHGELDAAGNPTGDMVVNAINNGVGLMGYVGHGDNEYLVTSSFGVQYFEDLTNTEIWPFMFDVACINGNFLNRTCFAEGFIRASHNGNPAGALAICASTILQSWSPPMAGQDEMINLLVNSYDDNIKHTFGGIHVNGCMKMMDKYGSAGNEMTDTWTIFGDPSVLLRTTTPTELVVNSDPLLFIGAADYKVTCETDGARATLSIDNEIIDSKIITNGEAVLTFVPFIDPKIATLTVVGFNKKPTITTVEITPAEGPYIKIEELKYSDVDGNNNQMPDYGEIINLGINLKNLGVEKAENLIISATTTDEYITLSEDSFSYGTLESGATASIDSAFRLTINKSTPDQHNSKIEFSITDGDETWNSSLMVIINAPVFEIEEMSSNNFNEAIDPGKFANINFTVNNIGHADALDVCGTLKGDSPYLTLIDKVIKNDIKSGTSNLYTFKVDANNNTPQGTSVNLDFKITFDTYADSCSKIILIGDPKAIEVGSGTEKSGQYPFYTYHKGNRTQILYLGSEFGQGEINILDIAFDFTRIDNGIKDLSNLTIRMKETTKTALGNSYTDTSGATTVLSSAIYKMPQTEGYQRFNIDRYTFNASKNLIIDIEWGPNSNYGGYGEHYIVNSTTTDFKSVAYGYSSSGATSFKNNSEVRPNIKFYVKDQNTGSLHTADFTVTGKSAPIKNAIVTVGSMNQITSESGQTSFDLYEGTYYYSVYAEGFTPIINKKIILEEDLDKKIRLESNVGITENNLIDFNIYPNPTNGILNVKYTMETPGKIIATLYSIDGKIVQNIINEENIGGDFNKEVNLKNIEEGIYFLNITVNNTSKTRRVIISK